MKWPLFARGCDNRDGVYSTIQIGTYVLYGVQPSIKRLDFGHPPQAPTAFAIRSDLDILQNAASTPFPDMSPEHAQNLTVFPSLRHRPVCRFESTNSLSPLSTSRSSLSPCLGLLSLSLVGRRGVVGSLARMILRRPLGIFERCRRVRWGLGGPIVNIPIIFVQEVIILLELSFVHGGQICGSERGQ